MDVTVWTIVGLILAASIVVVVVHRSQLGRQSPSRFASFSLQHGRYKELEVEILGLPPAILSDELRNPEHECGTETGKDGQSLGGQEFSPPGCNDESSMSAKATVAASVIPAAEYLWHWGSVDDHFFQAIEHMTHTSIVSIADVGHVIDAKEWAANSWFGASKGLVENVKGHIGEWVVQDHLHEGGAQVAMAVNSNQPGWDLLVGDHEVNVKTVADANAALAEHFAKYPGIAALVPGDAANIPDGAIHFDPSHGIDVHAIAGDHVTLVDDALSNADTFHAAQNGLDVAAGHVDLHFPFVTAAFSSYREGKLLIEGKTDLGRAAKNVSVDVTAVGGGAAAGAKIGGAIGTLFGPGVGTAVGAGLGGLIGGFFGRRFANDIKKKPLLEAQELFEKERRNLDDLEQTVSKDSDSRWEREYRQTAGALRDYGEEAVERLVEVIRLERIRLKGAESVSSDEVLAGLDRLSEDLSRQVQKLSDELSTIPWARRYIWPSQHSIDLESRLAALVEFERDWTREANRIRSLARSGKDVTGEYFDLLLTVPTGEAVVRRHIARLGTIRAEAVLKTDQELAKAQREIAERRVAAISSLNAKKREIVSWVKMRLDGQVCRVKSTCDQLVREMRKAGMAIPAQLQ